MTGWLALHGGGEFLPGDEAFLRALLERASEARVAARGGAAGDAMPAAPIERTSGDAIRVAIVPTAAARARPERAAAHGVEALERVASAHLGAAAVSIDVLTIVDRASACDPVLAGRLADAQLVYLPGGDPDLLPSILPGTPALEGLRHACDAGAVLAGASAGAMALADPCWTPDGLVAGLGFVAGLVVVPHADAGGWARLSDRFGRERPPGVGLLGLAERTGVLGRPGAAWRVAGEGDVRWLAADRDHRAEPVVAAAGDDLHLV